MAITRKGWDEQFMLSGFTKEDTYDAGATAMTATHAFSFSSFNPIEPEWDDTVTNDKDDVTGQEHGTDQEITEQSVKITVGENKAKPNTVAALAAMTLGGIVTLKDGADDAYRHTFTPIAHGSLLPSGEGGHKKGGIQTKYTGLMSNSIKLSGEPGGHLSVESELWGSGSRTVGDGTAFPVSITESWMAMKNAELHVETGANINAAIPSPLVQGADDISSATPDDFKVRVKSFEFTFTNNFEKQIGFGGAGVAQEIDFMRRAVTMKFTLNFLNSAAAVEFGYYTDQDAVAVELDLKGAQIDTSASAGVPLFYGIQIIVMRGKLISVPLPTGGPSDILTQEFELDVQNDLTNPACQIEVYNAQPGNGISAAVGYMGASS